MNGSDAVTGQITVGSTVIDVTYEGPYDFCATQVSGGTNFWDPSAPYTSVAVSNPPPDTDVIGLSQGGAKTITFSQALVDPVLALVSWNGNVVDLGTPIEILSSGQGYWGTGSFLLNGSGTGFTGVGEVRSTIRLPGTFTSIIFTDTGEYRHGFVVGITRLASLKPDPTPVPEPGTLALLGLGLLGLAGVRRAASA